MTGLGARGNELLRRRAGRTAEEKAEAPETAAAMSSRARDIILARVSSIAKVRSGDHGDFAGD